MTKTAVPPPNGSSIAVRPPVDRRTADSAAPYGPHQQRHHHAAVVLSLVISGGGTILLPKLLLRRILAWIWLATCTSGAALIAGNDASEVSY
ncbi:hypothetical protein SAMN04487819_112118 [Actinopolyspora alba]|uniref:Uncharacterized protein n=1 Tax=Actinopolyspora alba TaxID=673379 RepID=A0A1I2A7A8_9ACTN|nr:hypothetical protein SAMN04487819_112118 [Actinopolyspora alba]